MALTDPRAFIDAQSAEVTEVLAEMISIVLGAGGDLHPGLTLVQRGDAMTVTCSDDLRACRGQPLFTVPRELLVPVEGAQWEPSTTHLVLRAAPPRLSPSQRDLLDLHVALYNATGKIPATVAGHPRVALASISAITEAISRIRPGFTTADKTVAGCPVAKVFLTTRVFGLKPTEPGSDAKEPVLLPLIDLLNHHPNGATLHVDAKAMTPAVSRPNGGTECFARYGRRRDALDLALHYSYLDIATQFVRCPPVTVDVPGCGHVRIGAGRTRVAPGFRPPRLSVEVSELRVSQIEFHAERQSLWRVPLAMAVQARSLQEGYTAATAERAAALAADLIAEAALSALDALALVAGRHASANAAASLVAAAAAAQTRTLQRLTDLHAPEIG